MHAGLDNKPLYHHSRMVEFVKLMEERIASGQAGPVTVKAAEPVSTVYSPVITTQSELSKATRCRYTVIHYMYIYLYKNSRELKHLFGDIMFHHVYMNNQTRTGLKNDINIYLSIQSSINLFFYFSMYLYSYLSIYTRCRFCNDKFTHGTKLLYHMLHLHKAGGNILANFPPPWCDGGRGEYFQKKFLFH